MLSMTGRKTLCVMLLLAAALPGFAVAKDNLPPGFDIKRDIRVDEVRPGMKGYGMTVFHGVTPEPFACEVVSVERGFTPGKSVVWIRCPDPRMQLTGPVQGMSGSPIYLWTGGQKDHKLGEGGRLLGAFAFGHSLGKDCYVGVQPIENMYRTASRAHAPKDTNEPIAAGPQERDQTLAATWQLARNLNLDKQATWRLAAISKIAHFDPKTDVKAAMVNGAQAMDHRMMLPVAVGSAEQAAMLQPYFAPLGLSANAMKAGMPSASLAPKWIDPSKVKMEPGGVFAIPLVSGPLDMAAIGTCTDVLPDGTFVAFGHRMFAEGDTDMPMATGFIHFIQPNLQASFKLGGSMTTIGAVVRDEGTAVVGKSGVKFPSLPLNVHVRWTDSPKLNQDFEYHVVHLDRLLPALVASAVGASLDTDTALPQLNTVYLDANVKFANGRVLHLNQIAPMASPPQLSAAIVPPISALIESEFGLMKVDSIDTTVDVRSSVDAATIVGATLEQSTVKPGESVVVHIRLQPFRKPEQIRRVEVKIPKDTPDGMYNLTIAGSQAYSQLLMAMRPHLTRVANQHELFDAIQQLMSIRDDALYTVLRLNSSNNIAISRSEMPKQQTSKLSILSVPTSTTTTPYVDSINVVDALPYVVMNQVSLPVKIQQYPDDQN